MELCGFILGFSSYRGTTIWTSIETARKLLPYRLSSRIPICLLIVHPRILGPCLVFTFTDVHPASQNPEESFVFLLGTRARSVACQPKYAKITHPGSDWVKLYQLVLS